MAKRLKEWVEYNQDILVINTILFLKVLIFIFIYGSPQSLVLIVTSSLTIVFLLSAWIGLLPTLLRQSALLVLDICVTLLIIADSIYMRFFHRAIPILAFYQLDQLSKISSSVGNLLSVKDFLFAIDLIFLPPYLAYVLIKQQKLKLKLRKRFTQAVLTLVICSGFIFPVTNNIVNKNGNESISNTYISNSVLNNLGILNFHMFDIYNTFKSSKSMTLSRNDIIALKAWNATHQSVHHNFQGVALGKNLIIIQMESMQNFLINKSIDGQEVTPNLNKLLKSSIYFDNYFAQISQGNSSDAEFMTFNSLYPLSIGSSMLIYPKNDYMSLPKLLKDRGYNTFAIHGGIPTFWGRDVAYPFMGIDKFISKNDLDNGNVIGMGLSDNEVFTQAIPIIEQAKRPFMAMIITLSGHHPFVIPESERELRITPGEYSQSFVDYLQSQHYADKHIGIFIDKFIENGVLENSLLIVYGDHFGTGWRDSDIQKFLSISEPLNEYKKMELKKVPLIIRFPSTQKSGILHRSGGQMDLMPTIANLMGLEKEKMFCFGQDLLNQEEGFSVFRYYATDGSFVTDDFMYLGSPDGIFEHGRGYDRKTGQEVEVEFLRKKYNEAIRQLEMSDLILKGNAVPDVVSGDYLMNPDIKIWNGLDKDEHINLIW